MIFFVVLLIGGVLGYVFKGKVSEPLKVEMQRTITEYHKNSLIKSTWDNVQLAVSPVSELLDSQDPLQSHKFQGGLSLVLIFQFKCCGVLNYTDWEREFHDEEKVPMSCCKHKDVRAQTKIHTIFVDL